MLLFKKNKEREAEEEAKRRRKEIERERRTREKLGLNPYSGMGSSSRRYTSSTTSISSNRPYEGYQPSIERKVTSKSAPKSGPKNGGIGSVKGLSLKSKAPKTNDYIEALKQETGIIGTDVQEETENVMTSTLREA